MAIARVSAMVTANVNAPSFSVDLGTGADRYLVLMVYKYSGSSIGTFSVSGEGGSFTQQVENTSSTIAGLGTQAYRLLTMPVSGTGTQTVSASTPTDVYWSAIACVYSGVSGIGASAEQSNASTSAPTLTMASASGDVVVALGYSGLSGVLVASSPAALILSANTNPGYIYGYVSTLEETATTTSTTIDGTFSGASSIEWCGVVLQGAGGGGSSATPLNIITPNQGIAFASAASRSI